MTYWREQSWFAKSLKGKVKTLLPIYKITAYLFASFKESAIKNANSND